MADLGYGALLLSLVLGIFSGIAAIVAVRSGAHELLLSARRGMLAIAVLLTGAVAILIHAFLTHDFSIKYVAEQSSLDMPWYYVLSSLYGGQAGSLFYWTWMLSVFSAGVVIVHWRDEAAGLGGNATVQPLLPYTMATLMGILTFFLGILCFLTNPFEPLGFAIADGRGLNPLLRDYGMLSHPPMLLAGYMSWSVPFAFAVAAMVTGRLGSEWIVAIRRWTLVGWTIQGMGLLLGGWWAYHVLGWGGYWGWDPVENVALLPWLLGTAFLHSIMVQERRGMLKVWNLVLCILAFALSIFGTFVVRSGVISSVHSFAQSTVGPYFFAFLAVVLFGSLGLLFYRLQQLRSEGEFDSMLSRESAFLFNNLLFAGVAFVTFWGTIFPLLSEAVQNQKVTVGAPFYNQVNGPLFLVLLILMGIGPLLAWRRTSMTGLARSLRWPTAAAALLAAALWLAGLRSWAGITGFTVCLFVIGTILVEYWRGVRARRRTAGEGYGEALVTLVSRNRRRYGGYFVHLAIVVIAIGTIGSTFFQSERELTMKLGETAQVGRYTITYRGLDTWTEPGVRIVAADVLATSNGGFVGVLSPQKLFYRGWERQETTLVAVHTTLPWLEDLYIVLSGWDAAENSAVLHVFVNPLVSLIWAGGGLFLIGNVVAFWPVPARRRQVVPARPVPVLSPES